MILNINYNNKEIFDSEMDLLHNNSWIFVGLKEQLLNNNDFVTYEVGIRKIIVQNFEGQIKCFENICLHRFNTIQTDSSGNAPFMCKYHAWVYDSNGVPKVDESFEKELSENNRNCLKSYEVESCGEFIFVNVNHKNNLTLKEFLGTFEILLLDISTQFDCLLEKDAKIINHQANWKLLVENVLECYHCSSVHKETLVNIGIGQKKPENHVVLNFHDKIDYPIRLGKKQKERNKKLLFLEKRNYKHNSLRHIYVYPNLFITSTEGILFYIGRLTPISPIETNLLVNFVKPKLEELTKKEDFISKAFYLSSLESSSKVIYEDKEILENIQKNIQYTQEENQIYGDEEFRIINFHNNISKNINYLK